MAKRLNYSIVTHGVSSCSGSCHYCSAASAMNYTMGIRYSDLEDEIWRINRLNENEAVFDFNALEKRMDDDIKNVKKITDTKGYVLHIDFWGADGLNNFTSLMNEVEFFEDYCKKRNMKFEPHTSTNGLALVSDEIYDYCKKHDIHIQLSHDGLGQYMRTDELDPLDLPNVRKAIREGYLDWINCTLNFWNWSLLDNMKYFNGKLQEIFPEVWSETETASKELDRIYRGLYIKLNHIYDSDYDIRSVNKYGKYRGKVYEPLKGERFGNLALRNDYSLAKKTGIRELAFVLDNYINEWMWIAIKEKTIGPDNVWYHPYMSYIRGQINGSRIKRLNDDSSKHLHASCHAFQINRNLDSSLGRSNNFVIDTVGEYSECNLIDSASHVLNPTTEQPEYCSDCRYRNTPECLRCGSVKYPEKCEYQYRWNCFLDWCVWMKK